MSRTELAFLRDVGARPPSRPNTISAIDAACGAALRNARRRKGMHQGELARAFNVIPANVSQWETGRTRIPPEHVPGLATLLGVPPQDLIRPDHVAQTRQERILLAGFRAAPEAARRKALAALSSSEPPTLASRCGREG